MMNRCKNSLLLPLFLLLFFCFANYSSSQSLSSVSRSNSNLSSNLSSNSTTTSIKPESSDEAPNSKVTKVPKVTIEPKVTTPKESEDDDGDNEESSASEREEAVSKDEDEKAREESKEEREESKEEEKESKEEREEVIKTSGSEDEKTLKRAVEMIEKGVHATVENIKPLIKKDSLMTGDEKEDSEEKEDEGEDDDKEEESEEEGKKTVVYSSTTKDANGTIQVLQKLSKMVSTGVEGLFRESIPLVATLGYDSDLSSECLASLLKLFNGIRKQETWAWRLLDSYGRIAPGTFDGTTTEFGEYNQCLTIDFPTDEPIIDDEPIPEEAIEPKVVGKYCVMRIDIPMPPRPEKLDLHKPTINVTGTNLENTILEYLSKSLDHMYTIHGFRYGICIPSSCSALELQNIINKVIYPVTNTPVFIGPDEHCDTMLDEFTFNTKQKIAVVILTVFLFLALTATIYDLIRMGLKSVKEIPSRDGIDACASISNGKGINKNEMNGKEILKRQNRIKNDKLQENPIEEDEDLSTVTSIILSFSIIFNTKKLFHIREDREETLSAIHGMRILSMVWIIIGHTFCFGGFYKILYTFKRISIAGIENPARWDYQPLINTFLLVETFFFLGGVVLIYVALPMLEKHKGRFNYPIYVIHRWVRLTPAMIGTIAFITVMPYFGSGPMWKKEMTWQSEGCQKNWWMNILYISNWVYPVDEMCGGMTWFVAADFQIYLFAPIIFFSYYKSTILGILVNVLVLIGGMFSSGISAYINEIAPTFGLQHTIDLQLLHEYAQFGYFPTYHHIAPYAFGTLVGFLILKNREKPFNIPKSVQVALWIIAPLSSTIVLICTQPWNDFRIKEEPSRIVSILFSVTQRICWCIGVAWISFVCATGRGGIVNRILSWRAWIPLSRLSYSIYMVHLIPIFLRVNSLRYTRPWDDFEFVSWGFFNIILGLIGAYLLYIFFESPINNLEKLLFRPEVKKTPKKVDILDNNNRIMTISATFSTDADHDGLRLRSSSSLRSLDHTKVDMSLHRTDSNDSGQVSLQSYKVFGTQTTERL